MEAFTLLKYWRSAGASPSLPTIPPPSLDSRHTTTIHDNAAPLPDTDDDDAVGDDASFFDLEFSVGEDATTHSHHKKPDADSDQDCADDGDREFDFTLSSSSSSASSSNDRAELTTAIALSPSDDMFGQLVPMMDSSDAFNPKSQRIPVSLLKSATKFRVFLLGFKKSKANNSVVQDSKITEERSAADMPTEGPEVEDEENGKQSKLFAVKFQVEDVPIVSLFTRDTSSSSSSSNKSPSPKDSAAAATPAVEASAAAAAAAASDERQKFSKEALQKYLKKVKPLYVRVSKRYGEKLRFSSGQLNLASSVNKPDAIPQQQHSPTLKSSPSVSTMSTEKIQVEVSESSEVVHQATNVKSGAKQRNLQAGFRVVCKHLGKSRSASSAVAAAPPPTATERRDDSLLQQQDGIQSAILHCKRSFNASRESEFSRSVSDTSQDKSTEAAAKSCSEGERTASG
ncbi:Probable membrane-associated kinase regulator 2 [Linum perenne]